MDRINLGEIVKIKTGKLDANVSSENGKYPFFTCSKDPLTIDTYSYDIECILVAGNGDLNVKYYNGKFDAYQRTYILEVCNKEIYNTKYVYYFMCKYIEILRNEAIGGVIKYIKLNNLTQAKIPIVDIGKQKEIVNIISYVENIINLKKKQIIKLDELIKSQFVEMFGDPILNEKNWDIKSLKDISNKICSGSTPKGGDRVYVKSGVEFYRSQNVWKNKIEQDDIAYIDEETHNLMRKTSLKHNDLLITKTGRINTENSSLGRTAIYEGKNDKANINGHVYLIRLNNKECHQYILRILISDQYREYIRGVCVGGIDKRQLNKKHIEEFPIIYPPIELQNQFAEFVKQIDKQKFEELNVLEKELNKIQKNLDYKWGK